MSFEGKLNRESLEAIGGVDGSAPSSTLAAVIDWEQQSTGSHRSRNSRDSRGSKSGKKKKKKKIEEEKISPLPTLESQRVFDADSGPNKASQSVQSSPVRSMDSHEMDNMIASPVGKNDFFGMFKKQKVGVLGAEGANVRTHNTNVHPRVDTGTAINDVQLIEDGSDNTPCALCACRDSTVHLYDIMSGKLMRKYLGSNKQMVCVLGSPYAMTNSSLSLSRSNSNSSLGSSGSRAGSVKSSVSNTLDGTKTTKQFVVGGNIVGKLLIWDFQTGQLLHNLLAHLSGPIYAMGLYMKQSQLHVVTCSDNTELVAWNGGTGRKAHPFIGHAVGRVSAVCILDPAQQLKQSNNLSLLSNSKAKKAKLSLPTLLFSGGFDNKLRVWDAVTGAHQNALSGHPHEITTITAYYQTTSHLSTVQGNAPTSSDGKSKKEATRSNVIIYSGSADGSIRIWDLNAATCAFVLEGHIGSVVDCCYVFGLYPTVVSCSTDGAVRTWNSLTGKAMKTYKWHKENGASGMHVKKGLLGFAPLKIVIGTCSLDNTMLLHELDAGVKGSQGCCCIS